MSKGLVEQSSLSAIAAAIRQKNGLSTTYKPAEMAAAIEAIPTGTTPTGTVNITQNGTTDVTQYASANVNVPNSYSQSDEGKVVSNGELVAQTARSGEITENGTYDTTLNDEVTVNVSGGSGDLPAGARYISGIKGTGSQYINTNHKPTPNTKMVVCALYGGGYYFVAGVETNKYFSLNSWNGGWNFALDSSVYNNSTPSTDAHKIEIDLYNGTILYDGSNVQSLPRVTQSQLPDSSICFFKYNGSIIQNGIYFSFAIYEEGTAVHDYHPAIDQNGVVCFWDTVEKEFVYNTGSGVFIAIE